MCKGLPVTLHAAVSSSVPPASVLVGLLLTLWCIWRGVSNYEHIMIHTAVSVPNSNTTSLFIRLENARTIRDPSSNNTTAQQSAFNVCHADRTSTYYCAGSSYDSFANHFQEFILNTSMKPSTWGHRASPVPGDNKTILLFGNSHTRQLFGEIGCQYRDTVVSREGEFSKVADVRKVTLRNNITVVGVTNHYLVYSKSWPQLLRAETGVAIQQYDAIVLGRFNDIGNSKLTTFQTWVESVSANMSDISFAKNSPPRLQQLSALYDGPIVVVSMFALYNGVFFHDEQETAKRMDARRVKAVNARAYIPWLGECGTDIIHWNNTQEKTCLGRYSKSKRPPQNMHRCIGDKGGHPSLVLWDIVEALHGMMSNVSSAINGDFALHF